MTHVCSHDRRPCPRPECRERFGPYLTLEIWQDVRTVAHCHDWLGAAIEAHRREAGRAR